LITIISGKILARTRLEKPGAPALLPRIEQIAG
jgi:hypothetical protein